MHRLLLAPLAVVISACTMTGDVVSTGPDSYMISAVACPACGGTTKSMSMVFQEASAFCASQNKQLLREGMTNDRWFNEAGETVLEFRCLDEDHPAFVRADGRRDSDMIIEHR